MEKASKGVAWICIFSTLLMGCYSSVVVKPNGDKMEPLSGINIEYLVTKDGTRYDFVEPPRICEGLGVIVGLAVLTTQICDSVNVSISESAIAQIGMTESGKITSLALRSGKKYMFDDRPTIVNGTICGKAKYYVADQSSPETVSISRADVVEVHGSKYDSGATTVLTVFVALGAILGLVAIYAAATFELDFGH